MKGMKFCVVLCVVRTPVPVEDDSLDSIQASTSPVASPVTAVMLSCCFPPCINRLLFPQDTRNLDLYKLHSYFISTNCNYTCCRIQPPPVGESNGAKGSLYHVPRH